MKIYSSLKEMLPEKVETDTHSYWLITFTDLMSLLVAFFVMIYGMSTPNPENFRYLSESINIKPKHEKNPEGKQAVEYGLYRTFSKRGLNLNYLEAVLLSKQSENKIFENIKITNTNDTIVMSLSADDIFEINGGITRVKKDKERLIFEISDILKNIKNKVKVVGSSNLSDPKQNYKRSLTFASSLGSMLKKEGYKEDMELLVYGVDSFYGELDVKNAKKQSYKNRVDIVILSDGQDL